MKGLNTTARATTALGLSLAIWACATPGAQGPGASVAAPAGTSGGPASETSGASTAPGAPLRARIADLMPVGLTTLGVTRLGDAVYVLGGYTGTPHAYSQRDQSKDFFRFDLTSRRWDKLASVGPIQSVGLASDGRYVYRAGGMQARNQYGEPEDMHSVGDVARFDPQTGAWQALASLPVPRSSHTALISGTTLYVAGGWKLQGGSFDAEWQDSVVSCDLSQPACSWQSEPMPFRTRAHGSAVYDGKLYVLGGLTPEGESDDVHIFDLAARTWSQGPALPKGNLTICAATYGDRLYANGADGTVYRLSVDGSGWEAAATLSFPRMFHQLVSSPEGLLALGGIPSRHRGSRVRHVERVSTEKPPAGVVWTLEAQSVAKNRQGAFLLGQQLYVFGGNNSVEQHDFERDNFVGSAHRLDLGSLEWKVVEDFPARRQSMQTLVTGTEDKPVGLVVGGFGWQADRLGSQPDVFSYDFPSGKWKALGASMPESRSQFGLVEWQGAAWIIGGLNFEANRAGGEFRHPTAVLRMDLEHPEAGFAHAGYELREMRRAYAGARLGDRFYLTGGLKQDFAAVTSCEVLDLKTKQSSAMACPSQHRLGGELVPLGDRLYLVGGSVEDEKGQRQPTSRIERYEPGADKWSTISETLPLETPRQLQAFGYDDKLLLYSANSPTRTVQVALVDPAALASGHARYVAISVK